MSNKIYTIQKNCQVQNKLSIKFLKRVLKKRESIRNIRYYLIAKNYFYKRSGLFSLDELVNILSLDLRSLKNPGNKSRFKPKLKNNLSASSLFRSTPDGRFIAASWRKIANER